MIFHGHFYAARYASQCTGFLTNCFTCVLGEVKTNVCFWNKEMHDLPWLHSASVIVWQTRLDLASAPASSLASAKISFAPKTSCASAEKQFVTVRQAQTTLVLSKRPSECFLEMKRVIQHTGMPPESLCCLGSPRLSGPQPGKHLPWNYGPGGCIRLCWKKFPC